MNKITVTAPGKILLVGDHAVVYNRPCLVTAVDSRMQVTIEKIQEERIYIHAPQVGITDYSRPIDHGKENGLPKGVRFIEAVIDRMYKKYHLSNGLDIKTQNGFSSKYGLGSSSAVTVCTTKAMAELFRIKLNKREIFDISYQAVLDVQGVGSGFDVAAATWGGTLYYVTAGKVIRPLKIKKIPITVVYSGNKADTPTLIRELADKRQRNPQKIDNYFDKISDITNNATNSLESKDWKEFGSYLTENQQILKKLGVSTPKLDSLCQSALKGGSYGAKLTGAGGGDCIICLHDAKHKHTIEQSVVKAGGILVPIDTGAPGVRIEK